MNQNPTKTTTIATKPMDPKTAPTTTPLFEEDPGCELSPWERVSVGVALRGGEDVGPLLSTFVVAGVEMGLVSSLDSELDFASCMEVGSLPEPAVADSVVIVLSPISSVLVVDLEVALVVGNELA
ncbi:hypothetical protein ABW19_dt0207540 [Dactylella cylindrospora]|nr:hypothetical protein ABW19_dt0207540 [Dactylella cylindrospora]